MAKRKMDKKIQVNGSQPFRNRRREQFVQALAQGRTRMEAQGEAGISRKTAYLWERDSAVKARVEYLRPKASTVSDSRQNEIAPINHNANDVINRLWVVATTGKSGGAQVAALGHLADFWLLKAKGIDDLRTGIGWSDDEREYTTRTLLVPPRIAKATGWATIDDLIGVETPPKRE